jgi:hypothetical protein
MRALMVYRFLPTLKNVSVHGFVIRLSWNKLMAKNILVIADHLHVSSPIITLFIMTGSVSALSIMPPLMRDYSSC